MSKLNDRAIRAAKTTAPSQFLSDGAGLYLRVFSTGSKQWVYRFKSDSKTRWLDLGYYPDLSLADARLQTAQLNSDRRQGIVPMSEREQEAAHREAQVRAEAEEAAAQAARVTVRDLFERWASVDLVRRKHQGSDVRRMFEKDVLPLIGDMLVEDVRKGHITGIADAMLARGVTRMAKLVFSHVRQMFRFAVDRDIIEFEPSAPIRKAKIGGRDNERDRVLTEDEITTLVVQLPQARLTTTTQTAVWIALSTCCRIGELMSARWEHIDMSRKTWWIPPEHSKNGKAHTVYLSDFAVRQFLRLRAESEAANFPTDSNICPFPTVWVFPNRNRTGPLDNKTVTKQLTDRQRSGLSPMKGRTKAQHASALGLVGGKWVPHDLRRTGATMMVALGVIPEVAERCLNHTETNKVKRIYQRHSYEKEMREAWAMLGGKLDEIEASARSRCVGL